MDEYSTEKLLSVLVEITTFCNMECAGCIRTIQHSESKWVNQHLTLADFTQIIATLPPAHELVTQGVGEPTMHPQLAEIIRVARESNKFPHITLTTNAMVRPPEYYATLFDAGLSRLYDSVDSLDSDLANWLRAGTSVSRLTHIIRELSSAFPERIGIRTAVGRNNIHTIPELLAELSALGRFRVYMHPYDDMGNPDGYLTLEERATFEKDIHVLAAEIPNLRVITNNFIPSPAVCIHPWKIPAITADGYLTPCCRMMDKDVFTFGNMLSDTFRNVWDSESAQQMRKQFLLKSPHFCTGCPRFVMREGSTTKEQTASVKDHRVSLPLVD
jgi:radical SAM protein with 4Fe4S-binding SPASM domain